MNTTLRPTILSGLTRGARWKVSRNPGWMTSGIPACRWWYGVMLMRRGRIPVGVRGIKRDQRAAGWAQPDAITPRLYAGIAG
ncbi:phosphoribosyl-dephospho-CoA transferase [Citrobacter koseri]|uniref:Phosphoribosyl-dephospho-CoA transferase n=1 Tax=Citrobacter koseri TaxID=545 RepID=A0A2X2WMD4_CITKO|nr:phosphoribosyl-dephospho-CoA transferase [Citrobacter koseri]